MKQRHLLFFDTTIKGETKQSRRRKKVSRTKRKRFITTKLLFFFVDVKYLISEDENRDDSNERIRDYKCYMSPTICLRFYDDQTDQY